MKKALNNLGFRFIMALSIGLLVAQPILARERQGGTVQIVKNDGTTITGELIAVRGDSLLVEGNAMEFSNTNIDEIDGLLIKRKSHVAVGIGIGSMGGMLLGGAIGYHVTPGHGSNFMDPGGIGALVGIIIGALAGRFVGGAVGSNQSSDIVLIKGGQCFLTEAELLKKLRSQAKVRDAI